MPCPDRCSWEQLRSDCTAPPRRATERTKTNLEAPLKRISGQQEDGLKAHNSYVTHRLKASRFYWPKTSRSDIGAEKTIKENKPVIEQGTFAARDPITEYKSIFCTCSCKSHNTKKELIVLNEFVIIRNLHRAPKKSPIGSVGNVLDSYSEGGRIEYATIFFSFKNQRTNTYVLIIHTQTPEHSTRNQWTSLHFVVGA